MSIREISRRTFVKSAGASLAAPALISSRAFAANTFKIGLVAPYTGPLAGFGEAQDWILAGIKDAIAKTSNNGKPVKIELTIKDSQSNPNRAAEVAGGTFHKKKGKPPLSQHNPPPTQPPPPPAPPSRGAPPPTPPPPPP